MVKILTCLALIVAANLAAAQAWPLRGSDIPLGQAAASVLTAGNTLSVSDDGLSKFSVGGAYSYTFAGGGSTDFGVFSVKSDGRVCITFRGGDNRCDLYVRNGGLLLMLTEAGERFPVRVHLTLRP